MKRPSEKIEYWLVERFNEASNEWDPDQEYYIEAQAVGRMKFWQADGGDARYFRLFREPTRAETYLRARWERAAFEAARMAFRAEGPMKEVLGQLMELPPPNCWVYEDYDDYAEAEDGK